MANPQKFIYTAAGARTVEAKGTIADVIFRVSVEDTPLLVSLPHRTVSDPNPGKIEDSLQAVDTANYHADGATAPAATSTARSKNTNWCQLFLKTAEVSNYQRRVAQYGVEDELDYQMMLRLIEIKRDVEAFLISDQAVQAPTPANGRIGKMKGMSAIITTNTDAVADYNQANLNTLIRATSYTYGGNPTDLWLDATRKATTSGFTGAVTRYTSTDLRTLINDVKAYEDTTGQTLQVRPNKRMPQDIVGTAAVAFGLDTGPQSGWEILEYIPLTVTDLAITGTTRSRMIEWSLTILPGAEKANFAFVG